MKGEVQIIGLRDFPLINSGDDIASLIVEAARSLHVRLAHGDIIVIGHKVISKSEGRTVRLSEVKPSPRAFRLARISRKDPRLVQLILNESKRVIKASPGIVLVEAKQGVVCLNAGIDKSNVQGRDAYCLLPRDPDRSAKQIARRIQTLTGEKVRTVITDTYSRPFRVGQCEFAIGVSGLDPFVDYRGARDLFGRVLKYKRVSIADEIASAAELVMGQGDEGVPVAIVKGVGRAHGASSTARSRLMIQRRKDLFQGSI